MKVISPSGISAELLELLQKKKVVEELRIAQQGYRKPIISTEFNGRRIVVIGSEVFDAGNCKTFHEVLSVYLRVLLGEGWIKKELEKELAKQHPVIHWHNAMTRYQRENIQGHSKIQTRSNIGAISSQLYSALKKSAEYERIIFININSPEKTTDLVPAKWIHEAINSIRGAETRLKIKGDDAPPAYILLTNKQNACDLNDIRLDTGAVAESFKIPDFRVDYPFSSLKEAIDSRDRHKEVTEIFKAIKRHHKIPSKFDGIISENLPKL